MDRLFELLLLDALVNRAARDHAEEEEDRPDNFFVLPPNNNQVWQDVFKKCTEENMVVGVEFTTGDQSQKPIRAAILRLAKQFNRQAIFLRAPIGPFSTHDQVIATYRNMAGCMNLYPFAVTQRARRCTIHTDVPHRIISGRPWRDPSI